MKSPNRVAFNSFFAITLGVFAMIEWQINNNFIANYFDSEITYIIMFYLGPLIISIGAFLLSFDIIPIIAIYLVFFIYEIYTGLLLDNNIAYNYGMSFLVSLALVWAFKRLISY